MKSLLVVACSLLCLAAPVVAQGQADPAAQAEQYYRHGMAAVQRGAATDARRAFEAALRLNPGHANARYQLLQLRGNEGKLVAKSRELKLGQVTLPEVQFEDATLDEVLEALDGMVRKQTKDAFVPNFVIQDSSGKLAKAKVNIRIRNVPATVVLKYALDQAGGRAAYEEHAILIRPTGTGGGGPATGGETGGGS
jgi:hypothetical protein